MKNKEILQSNEPIINDPVVYEEPIAEAMPETIPETIPEVVVKRTTKFKGHGIVWDNEYNRPLCEFENREFTTADARKTAILTDLGYEVISVVEETIN